jgi:predicted ATPase/DNA-binding SARP family transcriptional activator
VITGPETAPLAVRSGGSYGAAGGRERYGDRAMEIRLLGPLEVESQGRVVELAGRRLRLVVAALALQAGRVVTTERLIDLLWEPASLPADPANALQALVSRLRRALEVAAAGERLVSRPPGYLLAMAPDRVDALRFERLAAEGHAHLVAGRHREAVAALRGALGLWRGPALADVAGTTFAVANATRLDELRLGALEDRITAELALGEHARLVGELEALAAEQPLRERPQALLMRALYGAGRQADALVAYQRARQVLAEQAGLDPGPELRSLQEAVLAHDPSLAAPTQGAMGAAAAPVPRAPRAAPAVPVPTTRRDRGNLRAALTSFVGREEEVARVLELLGRQRLVTLTGPGGVGKTRLAVEAARRLAGGSLGPDGTWLVELAGLRDSRLLPLVVLDVLGVAEERPRLDAPAAAADAEDRLLAALELRRALLVLDNCEHLADTVARLAERVLAACPEVRVLATSREPLRVPGEARWPVPALPVPPPGPCSVAELAGFTATRLFMERAAAAAPGFAVRDQADAAAVAEVCRRLDGLPLAIELAAARAGALPPPQLAARLDDRFRLLTAGARTALPRQQTLRAVVDWSWELLDSSERAALRRLAVFMGGSSLAAAEAVCAGPDLPATGVADTVARLVDKSLLSVAPAPAPAPLWWPGIEVLGLPPPSEPAGEPRYHLLETVRAYAGERLVEAGEADRAGGAHAAWFVGLAEAAEPELRERDQLLWFARVGADLDNLRAALQWLLDRGEAAPAVRLIAALGWFLLLAGHGEEAARSLEAALALPGPVPDRERGQALFLLALVNRTYSPNAVGPAAREARAALERAATSGAESALARVVAAAVRLLAGAPGEAERLLDASMTEVERAGGWPAAVLRQVRAFARVGREDLAGAGEDGEVALVRFRRLGDRWGMVQALELLASVELLQGRYGQATQRLEEALRCAWELRMASELGMLLCRLAYMAVLEGDLDLAEARFGPALAAAQEVGLATEAAFAHAGLSLVAQRHGDAERARQQREQALALLQRRSGRDPLGIFLLHRLGMVAQQQGDPEHAAAVNREAVAQAQAHGGPLLLAVALESLAGIGCAAGDSELAAVLLGTAATVRRLAGMPLPPGQRGEVDRVARVARRALGEDRFAATFARGEALSMEEAVAVAERP